jgi:hypothetical protein
LLGAGLGALAGGPRATVLPMFSLPGRGGRQWLAVAFAGQAA